MRAKKEVISAVTMRVWPHACPVSERASYSDQYVRILPPAPSLAYKDVGRLHLCDVAGIL